MGYSEPTLLEDIRRQADKLIELKKEKGVELKVENNWQDDEETYFKYKGEWISVTAAIKMTMALSLPKNQFKNFLNSMEK